MSRIKVYAAYYRVGTEELSSRTIEETESLPKGCYYTESEALTALKEREQKRFQEKRAAEPAIREDLKNKAKQIKKVLGDAYHLDYYEGVITICKVTPFGIFEEDL